MLLDADLDVQVAGRAAVGTRLAVAGRADAHAVVDAGGHLDLQRLGLLDATGTVTGLARILHHLATAVAGGTGLLHREEALLHAHLALAVTGATGLGLGAGLGAGALASGAVFPGGDADLGLVAVGGLLQRDFHGVAQVGTTEDLVGPAPSAAAAEDVAEDVAEGLGKATEAPCAAARATAHATHAVNAGVAVAVIGVALAAVAQHVVGLAHFLELVFGLLVTRVAVRVIFHGHLAIGLLDFFVGGVLAHPQHRVIVAFGHG